MISLITLIVPVLNTNICDIPRAALLPTRSLSKSNSFQARWNVTFRWYFQCFRIISTLLLRSDGIIPLRINKHRISFTRRECSNICVFYLIPLASREVSLRCTIKKKKKNFRQYLKYRELWEIWNTRNKLPGDKIFKRARSNSWMTELG